MTAIFTQDYEGMSALHLAAKSGDLKSVKMIMTKTNIKVNILVSSAS